MKSLPDECLTVGAAQAMLFQMAFALYVARHQCAMRHYDVKLLNFFLASAPRIGDGDTVARALGYRLGDRVYVVDLVGDASHVAKLADYGTADVSEGTLGAPVTADQFTTLANTPIAFDCVAALSCPPALIKRIRNAWYGEGGADKVTFTALQTVLEDDDDDTLFHTLYRFLVLFGLPELVAGDDDGASDPCKWSTANPVCIAVLSHLGMLIAPKSASKKSIEMRAFSRILLHACE